MIQIRGERIDQSQIVRYYPYVREADNEIDNRYYLYIYLSGVKDYFTICMASKGELDTIVEWLDRIKGVTKVTYTPEKEVTKANLTIEQK